jgi:hypothetical protein
MDSPHCAPFRRGPLLCEQGAAKDAGKDAEQRGTERSAQHAAFQKYQTATHSIAADNSRESLCALTNMARRDLARRSVTAVTSRSTAVFCEKLRRRGVARII